MKLESILSKFLPSSMSPKSIENFANNIETIGKIAAGLLAVFYVAGLVIFGLYHSKLHIRSIELLQVRYLLVGFYYFAFLFLHLAVPVWWIKRIWQKIIYLFVFLTWVVFFDPINKTYINSIISDKILGSSYYEFRSEYISVLNGSIIMLIISFLIAPIIIFFSVNVGKRINSEKLSPILIVFILFALSYNYQIFTQNIFPYIPDGIGGGEEPIVHIVFAENVPYEVADNFDLQGRVSGYVGDYYYGKLVYIDDNSVFLKEPFWYSSDVYEIQRKDIIMLNYTGFNPAEIGQPYLIP